MITKGRYRERKGIVTSFGEKFLTIKDKTGRSQTRIPNNVKVIR